MTRSLELGEEYTVRFVTIIPEKMKLKTLKMTDNPLGKPSRLYVVRWAKERVGAAGMKTAPWIETPAWRSSGWVSTRGS